MFRSTVKIDRTAFVSKIAGGVTKKIEFFFQRLTERMKAVMRLPKHGRRYRRGHIASAPGEAPAVDSARLINSIGAPVISGLKGTMRIGAPYASFLEEGTPRMAPRPFVRPSADVVIQEMKKRGTFSQLRNRFP